MRTRMQQKQFRRLRRALFSMILIIFCFIDIGFVCYAGKDSSEKTPAMKSRDETRRKPDVSKIYGKIKIVTSFADYKVKVVDHFPDLRVKVVDHFPDGPGKWQLVDHFPDYTIQLVDHFPDFTIKWVDHFPGK